MMVEYKRDNRTDPVTQLSRHLNDTDSVPPAARRETGLSTKSESMKIIKRLKIILAATLLGATSVVTADPVKIPIHSWTSQIVGAHIVGKLFEMVGEEVEYIAADSQNVYQSLCENTIDIVHEIWQGAFGATFEKQLEKGCVIDLATHDAKTREDWWYPLFVKEQCPGLPHWEALDDCAEKFSRADSDGKGVMIAGPVDWLNHDLERVEALEMDWVVKNAGAAPVLWAELEAAVRENRPVVIFNWTPNFIDVLYEGEFVEFPEYDPACIGNPAWGVNPDKPYDCGNPKGGYIKIGVSHDFKENHPRAFAVAGKINFSTRDFAKQINYVQTDGMKETEAAQKWLDEHSDKWKAWIQ